MIQYTCPGKVFILGEYGVLGGGRSIVGAMGPLFGLKLTRHLDREPLIPFAEGSPAGLLLARHRHLLEHLHLQWHDPYRTPIGVGSSSAQFVMSLALIEQLQGRELVAAEDVLHAYWDIVGTTQGLRPSGADVVAQFTGGPVMFRNQPFHCEAMPAWPGRGRFVLAFTGSKTKTHEHLLALSQREFPQAFTEMFHKLDLITLQAIEFWRLGSAPDLGAALNRYQAVLNEFIPASEVYRLQIESIQSWPSVYGCKGSGAQGGDCVLLFVDEKAVDAVCESISAIGWEPFPIEWSEQGLIASR